MMANLRGATLTKANLHAVDLSKDAGLPQTQTQAASSYTSEKTQLPANAAASIGPATSGK
ncbi:pentapeptide repeat-containing protein [Streptomyces sp. NPDC126514]|uniref:pentapeptide repeat-containing protein n=1 Tax=Streptomyces sp. NPDC126514 TaxID=3155210 RepID=UPI00331D49BB